MTAELAEGAEDTQKDFLREVQGFLRVPQQMQGELIHHALVIGDQPGAGFFIAGRTLLDQVPVGSPIRVSLGRGRGGCFRPGKRA